MNPIQAALALLDQDSTDTQLKTEAKSEADDAAAAAVHAADVAAGDLTAAVAKQNSDLDATKQLLEDTYRVK